MFPLQRGNELVIHVSNSLHNHQHKISEDLILEDHDSLDVVCSDKELGSSRPKKKLFYEAGDTSHGNSNELHKKKMVHKEIEKQRRQEMATLHASLRSLLPLEFIKGKRSVSDQIDQAVNYIKQLQKNIKELSGKRDELKKISNSKLQNHDTKYASRSVNIVHQNNGAVGIEISCFSEEGIPLSKQLEIVCKEGLEVVSCLSTKVNGRLLHSVQCEVNKSNSVDLSELRRKLVNYLSK